METDETSMRIGVGLSLIYTTFETEAVIEQLQANPFRQSTLSPFFGTFSLQRLADSQNRGLLSGWSLIRVVFYEGATIGVF